MNAEIIAIGSELLTPFRQDTNSLYLTEKLNQLGVEVIFKTIVGDSRAHLTGAATLALSRADIVIFMGGLGPTEDDLTREAVADALGLRLTRDPNLIVGLERRFRERELGELRPLVHVFHGPAGDVEVMALDLARLGDLLTTSMQKRKRSRQ